MSAIGIRVYGKVQGVFFRASTKTVAEDLRLTGWVRNEPDGTVLIHVEGESSAVQKLVGWCADGPEFARVEDVQTWEDPEEGLTSFEISLS